ncbi:unnamed protein product [Spirodela intermedia]|uniref:OCRE domain-containing protein n=1 Tax=Spirodela intermedia TaxID=51605 RepID=A0A7I8JCN5_SPIIN|nr:unnamed protein product [Spirodela intermedia]CAA6667934.1 unnamed protein product [Spirodela intermedia]
MADGGKVRFPKGKKARKGSDVAAGGNGDDGAAAFGQWMNPELAVRERTKRRNQNREAELFRRRSWVWKTLWVQRRVNCVPGFLFPFSTPESLAFANSGELYQTVNASFEDDGIRIEPFNLKQEREEGYFDAEGNYVEYVATNEIKEYDDLSAGDIGKIKRRIANALQPGETVLHALKRLKGPTGSKKDKMPEQIKRTFDQLTEDAMKLMEGGEYDVYYDKKETFEREAEGYERLAHAKEGPSQSSGISNPDLTSVEDIFSDAVAAGSLQANEITTKASSRDDDTFDMFGEEDENTTNDRQSDALPPQRPPEGSGALQNVHPEEAGEGNGTDYVFDESSGYYYSSSLGYYYDPASRLYCCAASGKWYSYDEGTGVYDEVQADLPNQAGEAAMDSS